MFLIESLSFISLPPPPWTFLHELKRGKLDCCCISWPKRQRDKARDLSTNFILLSFSLQLLELQTHSQNRARLTKIMQPQTFRLAQLGLTKRHSIINIRCILSRIVIIILIYHRHKPIDIIGQLGLYRRHNVFSVRYGQTYRVQLSFK
jgi:hypothetical protein